MAAALQVRVSGSGTVETTDDRSPRILRLEASWGWGGSVLAKWTLVYQAGIMVFVDAGEHGVLI